MHVRIIKTSVEIDEEQSYRIRNDVSFKIENGRDLLLPKELQTEITRKVHRKGHFTASKTEKVLKQEFYIPKSKHKVESVVSNCIKCIWHKKQEKK